MSNDNFLDFRKKALKEVKAQISEEEAWEIVVLLYLGMQNGLFKTLLENSNFKGDSRELLHIIETDDEMIYIVKSAMFYHICDDDIEKTIKRTMLELKGILTHIQIVEVSDKVKNTLN